MTGKLLIRSFSSVGQSVRLIIEGSLVQVQQGAPNNTVVAQLEEHEPSKLEVVGSSPTCRAILISSYLKRLK